MAQVLINGLVVGTTYALVALGLAIVFGIMRLVNFAHGQIYVVGGFVVYYAMTAGGLAFPVALAIAIVATAVVGAALQIAFFASAATQGAAPRVRMAMVIHRLQASSDCENGA